MELSRALAGALQRPLRPMLRVRQRCVDGMREIELPVTVRIRARELEERPGRRVQQVRLRCRSVQGRFLKDQLQPQLLDSGERHPKRRRDRSVSAQAVAVLVALRGTAHKGELHGSPPGAASSGVATVATGLLALAFSLAVLGRAVRRCCFSCWRAFLASSLCFRA